MDRKLQRHRAVSLQQQGFLVWIAVHCLAEKNPYALIKNIVYYIVRWQMMKMKDTHSQTHSI